MREKHVFIITARIIFVRRKIYFFLFHVRGKITHESFFYLYRSRWYVCTRHTYTRTPPCKLTSPRTIYHHPQNSDILIHERRKGATKNDRCVVKINPLNSRDRWFSWAEWIPSSLQSWLSEERKSGEKRKGPRRSFRPGEEAKLLNWKRGRDRSPWENVEREATARRNLYTIVIVWVRTRI